MVDKQDGGNGRLREKKKEGQTTPISPELLQAQEGGGVQMRLGHICGVRQSCKCYGLIADENCSDEKSACREEVIDERGGERRFGRVHGRLLKRIKQLGSLLRT